MPSVNQIRQIVTPIAQKYGLKRMYLFGSYAKGKANESSDIDLLIEKGLPLSLLKMSGLRQDTVEALGVEVDIVSITGIDEAFRNEIRGTEVLLYEA